MRRFVMLAVLSGVPACAPKSDARPDSAMAPAAPVAVPASVGPDTAASRTGTATPLPAAPSPASARRAAPASASPRTAAPPTAAENTGPVVAPTLAQVDTTITVRANGTELVFDPATITLKHGTRVRIRFANMGSFAHNFIVVRNENDIEELAAKAQDASEHVPLSLKAKMISYSNIAQPTRTVEMAFVVPPPGDYTYVCLVEGHANVMLGKLRSLP